MNIGICLLVIMFLAIFLNVPIGASLGLSTVGYFVLKGESEFLTSLAPKMWGGMNSFEMLAIPLFVLAGDLLYHGKISKSLVDLAHSLLGWVKGSMALVTTLACMFFGAVSGSGPATASAIGAIVAPEMEREGYDRAFTAAIIAASGPLGSLIPPSILAVVYAVCTGTSVGRLLLAGIGPALVMGGALMVYEAFALRNRNDIGERQPFRISALLTALRKALWALGVPIVILGGIYSGIFTPTEAAGVAAVYALVVSMGVTRSVHFGDLPRILVGTGVTTATIMFVVGAVSCFGWALTREQIPQMVAAAVMANVRSPWVFLLIVNAIFLMAGMFMNGSAAVLLVTPLLFPIAVNMGIDPIFFGAMTISNLCVGMCTPPVAVTLYVSSRVCRVPLVDVVRTVTPLVAVMMAAQLIVTFFPGISLIWPKLLMK